MVSVTLLWFIKEDNCTSAAFTWYGLMSCQVRRDNRCLTYHVMSILLRR